MTMCKHVVVSGKVQGVFYRNWTVETATALGLTGWVRNLSEGTVEALLCGAGADEMIVRMREGPERANVTGVDVADVDTLAPDEFRKRETV